MQVSPSPGLDFQLPDPLAEEDLFGFLNALPGYNPAEPVLAFPTAEVPQLQRSQSRSDEGSADAQQEPDCETDARLRSKIKNKTAQKRFRERQKSKAQENERRVAELSRELDAVRLENTRSFLNNPALLRPFLESILFDRIMFCIHSTYYVTAGCQLVQRQWKKSCCCVATSRRCSWTASSPSVCWCVWFS